MRILCWNVNGLRAVHRKGFIEWLRQEDPDICCLQEVKAQEDKLPPELRQIEGYHSYFVSAHKPGYSGVAIYSKEKPLSVSYLMNLEHFDSEGRMIIAEYSDFILIPTYFPSGSSSPERQQYKMAFGAAYLEFIQTITHKPLIICGDFNVAHQAHDLARPKENVRNSGFLPEEREWFDRFLSLGFHDSFRLFNQEGGNYTWWAQRSAAREKNVGWRLDYFLVGTNLKDRVKNSTILHLVEGSDHCPISLELD